MHGVNLIMASFACLKFGLFGLFFQPEQCFSLTTIQPEQYLQFSQNSIFQPVLAKIQQAEQDPSSTASASGYIEC